MEDVHIPLKKIKITHKMWVGVSDPAFGFGTIGRFHPSVYKPVLYSFSTDRVYSSFWSDTATHKDIEVTL